MTPSARGRRRRQQLLMIFSAVLLLAYARQLTFAPTAGQDFRAFFAAAHVVAQGGDPYDWGAVGRAENSLYNAPGHRSPGDPGYYDFLPFPEGPWLALGLRPLTGLPWQVVYPLFAASMLLAIGLGTWLILGRLGWVARRQQVAAAVTMLSPIAFLNIFQGQVSALVFLGFAAAWHLAARQKPVAAGALLTLVWIKPNLGLALPLVIVLMERPAARRLLLSFAITSALAFGGASLLLPGVLVHWANELSSHWRAVQGPQPDIASIHSFYYPALSGPSKTIALGLVLLGGAGYSMWALRRVRGSLARGLTLLLLWFALLPYVHSFDAILLLPVVAFLVEPDLRGWADPLTEVTLWSFAIIPFGYFVGLHLGFFNGFSAIPVALLLFAWHRRVVMAPPAAAANTLAA